MLNYVQKEREYEAKVSKAIELIVSSLEQTPAPESSVKLWEDVGQAWKEQHEITRQIYGDALLAGHLKGLYTVHLNGRFDKSTGSSNISL